MCLHYFPVSSHNRQDKPINCIITFWRTWKHYLLKPTPRDITLTKRFVKTLLHYYQLLCLLLDGTGNVSFFFFLLLGFCCFAYTSGALANISTAFWTALVFLCWGPYNNLWMSKHSFMVLWAWLILPSVISTLPISWRVSANSELRSPNVDRLDSREALWISTHFC